MVRQKVDLEKVDIRPATPEDAYLAGRLLFESFPKMATFIVGLGNEERAKGILERLFRKPGHRFSYEHASIAVMEDRMIGLLLAFPGKKLRSLDWKLGRLVLGQYRWRGKLALIIRAWPLVFIKEAGPKSLLVSNLAVRKRWRSRGVGGRLLLQAENLAKAQGLGAVSLIVAIDNQKARRFYEKHGYQIRAMHLESNKRVAFLGPGYQRMVKTVAADDE